ncbi:MAG: hypothetical protein Q9165_004122 [Trypethelium subeluteriae]
MRWQPDAQPCSKNQAVELTMSYLRIWKEVPVIHVDFLGTPDFFFRWPLEFDDREPWPWKEEVIEECVTMIQCGQWGGKKASNIASPANPKTHLLSLPIEIRRIILYYALFPHSISYPLQYPSYRQKILVLDPQKRASLLQQCHQTIANTQLPMATSHLARLQFQHLSHFGSPRMTPLLRTCRLLAHKARHTLYTHSTFSLPLHSTPATLTSTLRRLSARTRTTIAHLAIGLRCLKVPAQVHGPEAQRELEEYYRCNMRMWRLARWSFPELRGVECGFQRMAALPDELVEEYYIGLVSTWREVARVEVRADGEWFQNAARRRIEAGEWGGWLGLWD